MVILVEDINVFYCRIGGKEYMKKNIYNLKSILIIIFIVILLIGDLAKKERIMHQSYENLVDQNSATIDDEDDD